MYKFFCHLKACTDTEVHNIGAVSLLLGGLSLMGQNRKCTAEPTQDVKSVRDVKFANNYLNM